MAKTVSARELGEAGEVFVAQYLEAQGAKILDRNWRIREGELDIIAQNLDGRIIFVEVKSRRSTAFGDPLESITGDKALRIQRLALAWLATNGRLGSDYQIDVAGVIPTRSGGFTIDYRSAVL